MSFSQLGLSDKVLAAIEAAGYTTATPIQEQAIPHVLARRDVLGIAQTGTGKTAAFVLPMLNILEHGRARARMPRTLILEPTRELAAQVEENFVKYGAKHKLNVALLIGGVSFDDQDSKLLRGVDVLIATPGRLLDHSERGRLLLSGVELLVIDEADRMLDMGFIPDIERIGKLVPFTRQTLFFTATMPAEIQRIADTFLHNPMRIEVSRPATTASTVTQLLVATGREPHDKRDTLRRMIRSEENFKNAIIFCNRKREVALLHKSLVRHGFNAVALHGDLDQSARTAALDQFRRGDASLLVASDVAARGLDIPDVSHVFNFDVPHHADDYVHRVGRTGRAGKSGTAVTLVSPADQKAVAAIEKLTGQMVPWSGEPAAPAEDSDADGHRSRRRREPARAPREGRRPARDEAARPARDEAARPASDENARPARDENARPAGEQAARPEREPARANAQRQPRKARDERSSTNVARLEDVRAKRGNAPQREAEDDISNHLPAFLLRPVRLKA